MKIDKRLHPVWVQKCKFKAYSLELVLTPRELISELIRFSSDPEKAQPGWDMKDVFELVKNEKYVYQYISFPKSRRVTENIGESYHNIDNIPVFFDFNEKLLFVGSSSSDKLAKIESKGFKPLLNLTKISNFNYSGDFLYWLVCKYFFKEKLIDPNMSLENICVISSNSEISNYRDKVECSVDVIEYPQAKVLLALGNSLSTLRIQSKYFGKIIEFIIQNDGRIDLLYHDDMDEDDLGVKYECVKNTHEMVQLAYNKYLSECHTDEKSKSGWESRKAQFKVSLITKIIDHLTNIKTQIMKKFQQI